MKRRRSLSSASGAGLEDDSDDAELGGVPLVPPSSLLLLRIFHIVWLQLPRPRAPRMKRRRHFGSGSPECRLHPAHLGIWLANAMARIGPHQESGPSERGKKLPERATLCTPFQAVCMGPPLWYFSSRVRAPWRRGGCWTATCAPPGIGSAETGWVGGAGPP